MKLVWCPDTAGKAYLDTVRLLERRGLRGVDGDIHDEEQSKEPMSELDVAELLAAMAGGWNVKCIVEAWSRGDGLSTSLGLSTAARHTEGRHVCVVPDEESREEYEAAMYGTEVEVLAGEAEEVMAGIDAVDFAVVDCRRKDAALVLKSVRIGPQGAVVVRKEARGNGATDADASSSSSGFNGGSAMTFKGMLMDGTRVVRATMLPIGGGVEVLHVGVGEGPSLGVRSRWIKHIDRTTGEQHLYRRWR